MIWDKEKGGGLNYQRGLLITVLRHPSAEHQTTTDGHTGALDITTAIKVHRQGKVMVTATAVISK